MTSLEKLQAIFDREIDRLNKLSMDEGLDMAYLSMLEKLVNAYSKFKPQHIVSEDDLTSLSNEELCQKLNSNE